MSTIGRTVVIKGEVHAIEDLTLEGRVDGPITCENGALTLAESGELNGRVIARDITIFGRADGQLIATDVVDVRPGARVNGQVHAPRFILHDAARFDGLVEPQHLEAALRVAKFKQRDRAS